MHEALPTVPSATCLNHMCVCFVALCALQKYAKMEQQWNQVTENLQREKEEALQTSAARQQELSAVKDELQQAQSNIAHLTESLKSWQQKAADANQQVGRGLVNTAQNAAAQHSCKSIADCV